MQQILAFANEESKDFTYVGIGSCPHCGEPDKLDDRWDQLLPMFVREVPSSKTLRVIHFDPAFHRETDFLEKYFATKFPSALYIHEGDFHTWIDERVEIMVVAERFEHKDHEWFLEQLIDTTIYSGGQLVLQEYTGYDTEPIYRSLFDKSQDKSLFKARVLFDVTYGTDEGCGTDMTKYRPITDLHGNFFNTILYTAAELKAVTGIKPQMDALIQKYITGMYRRSLNTYHVDYRRRLKGETTVLYKSPKYSHTSEADHIMAALQEELNDCFVILRKLRIITCEKDARINELFKNYKDYDVYKWYDEMSKII